MIIVNGFYPVITKRSILDVATALDRSLILEIIWILEIHLRSCSTYYQNICYVNAGWFQFHQFEADFGV